MSEIERVAFLGDSYTSGSDQNSGKSTLWATLITDGSTISGQNLGAGGAGYVMPNANGRTIATQSKFVKANTDLVVMFGSRNDTAGYDSVRAAALETIETIRGGTTAGFLIIGPAWPSDTPPEAVIASRDALRDLAAEQNILFVDPLAEGWFVGTDGLIGSDNVHPTDAGHAFLADKIRPLVEAALLAD